MTTLKIRYRRNGWPAHARMRERTHAHARVRTPCRLEKQGDHNGIKIDARKF